MRLMRTRAVKDQEGALHSRAAFAYGYQTRDEMVKGAITGESGISHVRAAYDGFFVDHAFPGGYPILFGTADEGDTLCADCARQVFIMENRDINCDIYYEGPTYFCEVCNKEIPSAYGDPENPDDDDD